MLKQNVENCYIQGTKLIKLKTRNRIKISTPVMTKRTKMTPD